MPRIVQDYQTEDEPVGDTTDNVVDLMDGFYRLYCSMAEDPCFDDLAEDVAIILNEIEERRTLAIRIAHEEEHKGRKVYH